MANKTTADAGGPHLQLAEVKSDERLYRERLENEVGDVVEMVDYLRKSVFRGNLIREEVVNGALDMISGRLRMALNDDF